MKHVHTQCTICIPLCTRTNRKLMARTRRSYHNISVTTLHNAVLHMCMREVVNLIRSYTSVFTQFLLTRKVNIFHMFVHCAGVCKTHEAEHALVSSCSNCCSSLAYIENYCFLVVCCSFHRGLLSLLLLCVIHLYSCVIGRVRRLHQG